MLTDVERPQLSDEQLAQISKDELVLKFKQLQKYADSLKVKHEDSLKENEKKLSQLEHSKSLEIAKLKNVILMKYTASKEAETNSNQETNKIKQAQPTCLVDPAINAIVVQLKRELDETKKKKEELQNELNSWKFNPESQMGKRLMAKCRKLLQENEELGKVISSGNVAQLEHDLAYHKELLNEACENEQNINSFLSEMDDEMNAMQATIVQLQQRLKMNENVARNERMDT